MEFNIEKVCCFTGHRPEKCKGTEEEIRTRLATEIQNAIGEGYNTFITGMAPGVDTWAADEVLKIKSENKEIKLIAAVPFPGVEKTERRNCKTVSKRSSGKSMTFNTFTGSIGAGYFMPETHGWLTTLHG